MTTETRRGAWVSYAIGGGALVVGLALAVGGSWSRDEGASGEASPAPAPAAGSGDGGGGGEVGVGGGAPEPERYVPDLSGEDIGRALTSRGASAHGLAVMGERIVWIETEGAAVASLPLAGGEVTTLSSVDDEDRYGGAFASSSEGVFWSVGDVGGAPDPIYFVTPQDLGLKAPALTPLTTASSVDAMAAVAEGQLYFADGARLIRLDDEGQTLVAERAGRLVALAACGGALWWLEAPLSGRGEHALMTLDENGEPRRRAALDEAERGPTECWKGQIVWASDRPDGSHRLMRFDGAKAERVALTGTVSALAVEAGDLYWAEVHGEGGEAVSLLRGMRGDGRTTRIGRDAGTATALAVAGATMVWASDDGLRVHGLGAEGPR